MTVKMMKVVAYASVVVCLGSASAQQTISVNFGQQETSEAPQPGVDTVKVQGRGVGANRDEALKDAYRDAVERAVGLYVDAEVAANNDELVKDQVLTQSNAYITDYRELGETKLDGGLVQVRILATVKKQALAAKLSGVMPAQTASINSAALQNVHAQLVTKEKRAEDGAALLKNALDGLNPMKSLMAARVRPETQKIITGGVESRNRSAAAAKASDPVELPLAGKLSADQVMLRYLFEVQLDRNKYFAEFVPHLKKVLEQISLSPPKEIRLTELVPENKYNWRNVELKRYLTIGSCNGSYSDSYTIAGDAYRGTSDCAFLAPVHVYSILWKGDNRAWEFGHDQYRPQSGGSFSWKSISLERAYKASFHRRDLNKRLCNVWFALITSLNADCSNGKVTMYELDESSIRILADWSKKLIYDWDERKLHTTDYNIVLLDKNGEEIGAHPWRIPNALLTNMRPADTLGKSGDADMVYATPFIGCFGESLIQWRDFILEKDQLQKVASIKIEPVD